MLHFLLKTPSDRLLKALPLAVGLFFVAIWSAPVAAQVVNGDFETRTQDPQGPNNIYGVGSRYDDLPNWEVIVGSNSIEGTGDYLASPAADPSMNPYITPYGGAFAPHNGSMGCIALRRNRSFGRDQGVYEAALVIPGHTYQVDFYVLRRPLGNYAEKIRLIVTNQPPSRTSVSSGYTIYPTPYATITSPAISDYNNWTHVTGSFVAQGATNGSAYTFIGLTYDQALAPYDPQVYSLSNVYGSEYYAIDDVSLTDLTACAATLSTIPGPIGGYYNYAVGRLDAEIPEVPGALRYNWYRDGVLSLGRGNFNSWLGVRNECGSPTITVEAVLPCGTTVRTSRIFQGPTTGCQGGVLDGRVANTTAYPNPATESITIPEGAESATLVNDKGKVLQKADATGKVDIQALPNGLYNLQIMRDGKLINQRIQVKH